MQSRWSCIAVLSIAVLATAYTAVRAGQTTYEYGSSADLRGVTKVYIFTGPDLESQQNIAKRLLKDLPTLTIASAPEAAEVVLLYGRDLESQFLGIYNSRRNSGSGSVTVQGNAANVHTEERASSWSAPLYQTTEIGQGRVVKVVGENRLRLIVDFRGTKIKGTIWKRPSSKFASAFIKAYREGNKH